MDSSEKTLAFALIEIDRMACALKLPNDIKEAASVLYRRAAKQNLIKGRSIEELVSAMLYIICRQYGVPRTLKEIAEVSRSPLKKIRRAYIFLLRKFGLKVAPADPSHYIPRFCSALGLSEATRERAIEVIKANKETGSSRGWAPIGTAAAANDLGYLQLTYGEFEEARRAFEQALSADPFLRPAVVNLASLLASAPDDAVRDGDRALELARRSTAAGASQEVAWDLEAMALAELGRFEEAAQVAARAVARAQEVGKAAYAADVARREGLYRLGRPYRSG